MRMILTGILAMLVLSACSDSGPADVTPPEKRNAGGASGDNSIKPEAPVAITTGDVEQKVFLNGSVPQEGLGPNVKIDQMKDSRGKINMVTVDVYPPFPEHLPLLFDIGSRQNWEKTPLVIRGKATIEGYPEPIGQVQFVWGGNAMKTPHDLAVDVMPSLPTVPDSVLVVMRADAMLMPEGTDAATVDPATATAPELSTTILLSTPIRINFHQEPAPAPTTEDAAPPIAPAPAQTPAAPGQ